MTEEELRWEQDVFLVAKNGSLELISIETYFEWLDEWDISWEHEIGLRQQKKQS